MKHITAGAQWRPGFIALLMMIVTPLVHGDEKSSWFLVDNRSGQIAKIAAPGSKAVRVPVDASDFRVELTVEKSNGVEAKAWWVTDPRQLCVIFVRYEGKVVIAGKKILKCLGN